ncbi:MAG: hypothetical protein IIB33_05800 [Chloroflexi bacterium]|nr:hypothetical protein [Chloroflexota bacterium]
MVYLSDRAIPLLISLAILLTVAGCGAGSPVPDVPLTDWPPFTMVYEIDGSVVSVGGEGFTIREVHRFEFTSKSRWTDTVVDATPSVDVSQGVFSRVGSYQRLDGRKLVEFDALDGSRDEETIDEGVRFLPNAYLAPFLNRALEEVAGITPIRVETGILVCFREECEENAVGLLYRLEDGREHVFVDDSRGFPLKMGDAFVVKEIRVDDERR